MVVQSRLGCAEPVGSGPVVSGGPGIRSSGVRLIGCPSRPAQDCQGGLQYEERTASIARGREGQEKFGPLKVTRKREAPRSSTQGAQQADHDEHGQQLIEGSRGRGT